MNLEEYISHLNKLAFWKEFTFSQNKFKPHPGKEFELADNIVWFGDYACVMQLKQRSDETDNSDVERNWFRKKVLDKATGQIRDTLRFLKEHKQVRITNERGHVFDIDSRNLNHITKIVVFLAGETLPDDCWNTRYHVSRTAGFIHILAAHDYLGIIEKLRVPEDIRRYFAYREEVVPKLRDADIVIDESDIMGGFLSEEDFPTPKSREILYRFVQDLDDFDLSGLIGSLHEHIQRSKNPYDYYSIMLEFARVPRAVWREIKIRFVKSLEAVLTEEFTLPFRLSFPATDCAFMIAPFDSQMGSRNEKARVTGLQNLTYAAKYDAKVSNGVGILISRDGECFCIDWCLVRMPWALDPEMEDRLAKNSPFRKAKEKIIDSFLFVSTEEKS